MVKAAPIPWEVKVCDCERCKKMCRTAPCIGTPEDIQKLIDAGHANKLEIVSLHPRNEKGKKLKVSVPLIRPKRKQDCSDCIFFTDSGLCSLHDSGLKPLEGKLAIHTPKEIADYFEVSDELWPKKISEAYKKNR